MPKSVQGKAKRLIHEMYLAPTRKAALARSTISSSPVTKSNSQKPANACTKIKKCCLPFYDFPAQHWPHLRTTNPIESTGSVQLTASTKTDRDLREDWDGRRSPRQETADTTHRQRSSTASRRVYLRGNEALGVLSLERLIARNAAAALGRWKARCEANSATGCGRVGGKDSPKAQRDRGGIGSRAKSGSASWI